jgi:ElaB/YqjD/DUF883 family membrane-anchored ribosome-binding protein
MPERMQRSSENPSLENVPVLPVDRQRARSGIEHSSLEQRAAELGAAAGKIAFIIRQTRERVEKLAHRPIHDRISGIAENARLRAERLREAAGKRAEEFGRAARNKTAEFRRQAQEKSTELARQVKEGYVRARDRAGQTVREYPVHTAAAAGVVGFLVGVGLRIRRAKRAY